MNDDIKELIAKARVAGPMTRAEVEAQRRSFVRAEIGLGSDADEIAYRSALASGDQEALAKLNKEAEARMAQVDAYFASN